MNEIILALFVLTLILLMVATSAIWTMRQKRQLHVLREVVPTPVLRQTTKSSSYSPDSNKDVESQRESSPSSPPEFIVDDAADDTQMSMSRTEDENELPQTEYKIGDILNERYKILEVIGEGAYGKVVKAVDQNTEERVAIKIVLNATSYPTSQDEIKVFRKLQEVDPRGTHLWSRMLSTFALNNDRFIVFELLSLNMHTFQKKNNYAPYDIDDIRHIAYQLCHSVAFLHRNKIVHTDIKPENIVFVNVDPDECKLLSAHIKLIDFGCAQFESDGFSGIISTIYYRAPEVILRLGWSYPADVWSIACTLFEAYSSYPLFGDTRKSRKRLAIMEIVLGPIPDDMQKNPKKKRKPFFVDGQLVLSSSDMEKVDDAKPLLLNCRGGESDEVLFDLLHQMLVYMPEIRVTCAEAIKHHFFYDIPDVLKFN